MNQQPRTFAAIVGIAIIIFLVWAWAMNDDFKQDPACRYDAPYAEPYPTCTDTTVVLLDSSYKSATSDCGDD